VQKGAQLDLIFFFLINKSSTFIGSYAGHGEGKGLFFCGCLLAGCAVAGALLRPA
jgi:hypothetical protein